MYQTLKCLPLNGETFFEKNPTRFHIDDDEKKCEIWPNCRHSIVVHLITLKSI